MNDEIWHKRRSGFENQRGALDHRSPYERDHTRIIHAASFRKLQRKTQILATDSGDFHRTRLTHSLEVASIGRSIVHHFKRNYPNFKPQYFPDDDLISSICLLHDIGHPPFGHAGEKILNHRMQFHGGFEGNAQTLRLITKIENNYAPYGLDLTRRTIFGILKYPNKIPEDCSWNENPIKGYYECDHDVIAWLIEPFKLDNVPQTIDCAIMNLADDLAYGVHDLEDAIHLKLITRDQLDNQEWQYILNNNQIMVSTQKLTENLFSAHANIRKQAIGELVHYLICSTIPYKIDTESPIKLFATSAKFGDDAQQLIAYLHKFIFKYVISATFTKELETQAKQAIQAKFDCLKQQKLSHRSIADSIANLSDAEI